MQLRFYPQDSYSINTDSSFKFFVDPTYPSIGDMPIDRDPSKVLKTVAHHFLKAYRHNPDILSDFNIFTNQGTYSLDLNHLPTDIIDQYGADPEQLMSAVVYQAIIFLRSKNIKILGMLSAFNCYFTRPDDKNKLRRDAIVITYEIPHAMKASVGEDFTIMERHQIVVPHEHGVFDQNGLNKNALERDFWDEDALAVEYDIHSVTVPQPSTDDFFTQHAHAMIDLSSTEATLLIDKMNEIPLFLIDTNNVYTFNSLATNSTQPFQMPRTSKKSVKVRGFGR